MTLVAHTYILSIYYDIFTFENMSCDKRITLE